MNKQNEWLRKHPWYISYKCARGRCVYKSGRYYGKVSFNMNLEDFKYLWFRDKAYLMEKPSIDRIDSKGSYTLNNCRFLEAKENQRQGLIQGGEQNIQLQFIRGEKRNTAKNIARKM